MPRAEDEKERICLNCNHYFPAAVDEPTEFGICLNDEEFEPFSEEILAESDFTRCLGLVEAKKFPGEREACQDFEEAEFFEIDDESPLGRRIRELYERGELNLDTFKQALLEEELRRIDWKAIPVDGYLQALKGKEEGLRDKAIDGLGTLVALGNEAALRGLSEFLKALPVARDIEQVHLKKRILRHLARSDASGTLIPYLVDELSRTPSNNTTRQWISEILRFLERSPWEEVHAPLERALARERFSPRVRQRIREILSCGAPP